MDLPDPEWLLAHPDQLRLPVRGDQVFAILTSVITTAILKNNRYGWDAAWTILGEAAQQGGIDVALPSALTLSKHRQDGYDLPMDALRAFRPVLEQLNAVGA